jgi:hypothetical protein
MIRVEESGWPLVHIWFEGTITLEEVATLAETLHRVHKSHGPMVLVGDLGHLRAASVNALHRKAVADVADALARDGALVAEAVIAPQPVLRALFTGYTWLRSRTNHPQKVFAEPLGALAWAREQGREQAVLRRSPPNSGSQ